VNTSAPAFALSTLSRELLIVRPLTIAAIVVGAVVIRLLVHRVIGRLTRDRGPDHVPALLRPLRDRAPERMRAVASPLLHERRKQRAETMGSVLKSVTSIVVLTLAVIYVLGAVGLNVAPLIASAGIVGVALGFGAQNLVRDFLSGVFMILEDQYGVGDVVDLGVASGVVEGVGLRVTTLRDINGTVWYCRNARSSGLATRARGSR